MSLHIERQGDVAIVVPNGPLDGSKLTRELETAMRKLISDGQEKIVLDLGKTSRVSSIGAGILASLHLSTTRRDVAMHVCNINKRIEDLLIIIQLIRVLKAFDTREDALAAFEVKLSGTS